VRVSQLLCRAAAGFFAVALLFTAPALASVKVAGVPEWIRPTISGPVGAVWEEVLRSRDPGSGLQTLRIVVERIFPGVVIEGIELSGEELLLDLSLEDPPPGGWEVSVKLPDLVPELETLFYGDMGDAADQLREMIAPLPVDSLSWAGQAFQQETVRMLTDRIPGWYPFILFVQGIDGEIEVLVSFNPLSPVIIAYSPRISSRTFPRILQTEIADNALEALAPFLGLPGDWVDRHRRSIEELVAGTLETKWAAREVRGDVTVGITPERIAPVEIRVESDRYTLQAWAAVHLGSDERHPEIGVHIGRMTSPIKGWDLEIYGEFVTATDDLDLESRWGARWSAWPDVWIGAETAHPGEDVWFRVWLDEILPRVYLWGRLNGAGDSVAGIGWRFGGYLAWELYYDNRDEDSISVRLVGNL